jgi:dephospho-CoA kinase
MARDGLGEAEARKRIAAQWPLEKKLANADYVIRTDGTFDETNLQIDAVVSRLRSATQPTG